MKIRHILGTILLIAILLGVYWARLTQHYDVYQDPPMLDISDLQSESGLLTEMDSGAILAEKNPKEIVYPASLTKMMTALVAIEMAEDMDSPVTISDKIYPQLYAEDASMAGFLAGETVTVSDLLYGTLLRSGAECCLTLANYFAGSEPKFVTLMNEKAEELGMNDTHFCNTTGLHDPRHVSTVTDLSILLRYALNNDTFRQIFTTKEYQSGGTDEHPEGLYMESTTFQWLAALGAKNVTVLGGKTGYTKEAGYCLATLISAQGRETVLVTAKGDEKNGEVPVHVIDAASVFDLLKK